MTNALQFYTLQPDDEAYPGHLSAFLDSQSPDRVFVWGNPAQWPLPPGQWLALICSIKAPAGVLLAMHDLAQQWRPGPQVIVSGFHSPVEQEAYRVLLRGPAAVVRCPARSLARMRLKPAEKAALAAGHLWLLSPFDDKVRRATQTTAAARNRLVAALAGSVLVAHARPGSKTEQLAREVMAWGKPLYTLPHEANGNLLALGAVAWE